VATVLAALAVLTSATAAQAGGGILTGAYLGLITGIEGNGSLGFKGGNMRFQLGNQGRITIFKFSKIRVACTDGRVYRTSGHASPDVRVFRHNGARKFKFTLHSRNGALLKGLGFFRGTDHARGFLKVKGRIPTSGGEKTCTSFRQLWSAQHSR